MYQRCRGADLHRSRCYVVILDNLSAATKGFLMPDLILVIMVLMGLVLISLGVIVVRNMIFIK